MAQGSAKAKTPLSADILSVLTASEVAVTGAVALDADAYGVMHKCSGSTYEVTLPTPVADSWIGFRFETGLTGIVTVGLNGSEDINGRSADRKYTYGETAIYFCDGTDWWAQEQLRMIACDVYRNAVQDVDASTTTVIEFDTEDYDSHACYDAVTNYRFTPDAPGIYGVAVCVRLAESLNNGEALWVGYHKIAVEHWVMNTRVGAAGAPTMSFSRTVELNGSTDYVQGIVWHDYTGGDNKRQIQHSDTRMCCWRISNTEA